MQNLITLFSFNGRINRLDYFLRSLAILAFGMMHVPFSIYSVVNNNVLVRIDNRHFDLNFGPLHSSSWHEYETILATHAPIIIIAKRIITLIILWFLIASQIKRLHDINVSGWMSMLNLIPGAGFILWLVCIIATGSRQANRFGDASNSH